MVVHDERVKFNVPHLLNDMHAIKWQFFSGIGNMLSSLKSLVAPVYTVADKGTVK